MEKQEEEFLSCHCLSMRRALLHCQEATAQLEHLLLQPTSLPVLKYQHSINRHKDQSCTSNPENAAPFMGALESSTSKTPSNDIYTAPQQQLYNEDSGVDVYGGIGIGIGGAVAVDSVEPRGAGDGAWFADEYLRDNRPCLLRGPTVQAHFEAASTAWVAAAAAAAPSPQQQQSHATSSNSISSVVPPPGNNTTTGTPNREWFLTHIGANTRVPVRRLAAANATTTTTEEAEKSGLDEHGRATECATQNMTLADYIRYLDDTKTNTVDDDDGDNDDTVYQTSALFYLKDWHLQAWLEEQHQKKTLPPCGTGTSTDTGALTPSQSSSPPPLSSSSVDYHHSTTTNLYYTVPQFFPHDLLNSFCRRFTNGGDYRFVYWGPAGSGTSLHSDVVDSYSWSFNVCGIKEWTFLVPPAKKLSSEYPKTTTTATSLSPTSATKTIVVEQGPGELMFVPSGWQHSVVNRTETLSINHNWISTHNLHRVWQCLFLELGTVNAELASSWNIQSSDAREQMLRGCTGLDVTAFFFLVLTRGLDLLLILHQQSDSSSSSQLNNDLLVVATDLERLGNALEIILNHDDSRVINEDGSNDIRERIDLTARLQATLAEPQLGNKAIQIAMVFLQLSSKRVLSTEASLNSTEI